MKTEIEYELVTEEDKNALLTNLNDALRRGHFKLKRHLEPISSKIGYMCEGRFVNLSNYTPKGCVSIIDVLFQTNQLYKEVVKEVHWTENLKDNPKWCKVRDSFSQDSPVVEKVTGYDDLRKLCFEGESSWWSYAEPLSDELQILLNKEMSDE